MAEVTKEIPRSIQYSFKEGDTHIGVWAIQRGFNALYDTMLIEDGVFGGATLKEVYEWQEKVGLTVDGVFGPTSQKRFVRSNEARVRAEILLPDKLVTSMIEGESGNYIAAVNWSVAGGVDCGYTQRRVYEQSDGTYRQVDIERAFDSLYQFKLLGRTLRSRKDYYITRPGVVNRSDKHQYAWRLAVLHHNWPYAAARLADGYKLSDQTASWVPPGTKFDDGAPVRTYSEWAQFYAMGATEHDHKGKMVKYVSSWIQ